MSSKPSTIGRRLELALTGWLPDDVRRSLPALQVGGSVYSSNPRDRLLILNGRPFQEGEMPAPEVTLEEIRLKSAVMRYRNHRYTINY